MGLQKINKNSYVAKTKSYKAIKDIESPLQLEGLVE